MATIIALQFASLRDGGRFWYGVAPSLTAEDRAFLADVSLGSIIEQNTSIRGLQGDVFHTVPEPASLALLALGVGLLAFRRRRQSG